MRRGNKRFPAEIFHPYCEGALRAGWLCVLEVKLGTWEGTEKKKSHVQSNLRETGALIAKPGMLAIT